MLQAVRDGDDEAREAMITVFTAVGDEHPSWRSTAGSWRPRCTDLSVEPEQELLDPVGLQIGADTRRKPHFEDASSRGWRGDVAWSGSGPDDVQERRQGGGGDALAPVPRLIQYPTWRSPSCP